MADPVATTTGSALALGVVTITGSVLGLQLDALCLGFVGALVALMHTAPEAPRTPLTVFAFVTTGAFAAGLLAPIAAAAARQNLDAAAALDADTLRMIAAGLIGATAHAALPALRSLVPAVLDRLRGLIGGGGSAK